MTRPKVNVTGDVDKLPSRPESCHMEDVCPPPPPKGGPTLACQHPHTLATCSLEGHLLFSFAVLLYQAGIFFPRLNMTFDKDVFVVPSQDILGPAVEREPQHGSGPLDPKVHLEIRGCEQGGREISAAEQRAKDYQT